MSLKVKSYLLSCIKSSIGYRYSNSFHIFDVNISKKCYI